MSYSLSRMPSNDLLLASCTDTASIADTPTYGGNPFGTTAICISGSGNESAGIPLAAMDTLLNLTDQYDNVPVHSEPTNGGSDGSTVKSMLLCNEVALETTNDDVLDDALHSDPDHIAINTHCLRVAGVVSGADGVAHMRQCKYAPNERLPLQDIAIEELILAVKCGCIPYKYHCLSLKLSGPKLDVINEMRAFKRQLQHDVTEQLVAYKRSMYQFQTMSTRAKTL